ncbi:MAG: hypothetical protein A2078_07740 [Nitrospirae bacterium GWC2_57_9]|nr:MAG: hypothetical protein A2078_07740 [Nitrospirae bacterium GWC2_57_9]
MRYFLLMLILLQAVPISGSDSPVGTRAPELSLFDQYDKEFCMAQYAGSILVFLASDRDGAERNRQCGGRLGERYGNRIAIIGIADTRGVPFFLKRSVKNSFRKERVRVLLDWKGEAFTAFGLSKKSRAVVLIDRDRTIRQIYSSPNDICQLAFADVDRMLAR